MRLYEGLFLIDAGRAARDWEGAEADIVAVLEKHGASFRRRDRFDERKLAYPVQGSRRGAYLLAYLDTDPQSIEEMRQDLTLSESVLRFMFTRMADTGMPESSTLGNMEPMGAKPVVEETKAKEPKAPAAESKAPAAESKAPAAESKAPAAESKAPAAESKAPAAESKAPASESKPEAEAQAESKPPASESKPEAEAQAEAAPEADVPVEEPKAEAEGPAAEPEAEGKES